MLFDGTRALIVGDYVTPATGEYAGQLGPWSKVVQAAGIEPRSALMKSIFVLYGLAALAMALCFALGYPGARTGMLVMAVLGLWYLPFGTVSDVIILAILLPLP
jgi:hypothetical protein